MPERICLLNIIMPRINFLNIKGVIVSINHLHTLIFDLHIKLSLKCAQITVCSLPYKWIYTMYYKNMKYRQNLTLNWKFRNHITIVCSFNFKIFKYKQN